MRVSSWVVALGLLCVWNGHAFSQAGDEPEPTPGETPKPGDAPKGEPAPGDEPKPADAPPAEAPPADAPKPVDAPPGDAPPADAPPADAPKPAEAAPTPAAQLPFQSPEVVALFPAGVLEKLPAAMAPFIGLADFKRIHEACPQPDAAAVLACAEAEPAASLIGNAYLRGVVTAILSEMDVALAPRLQMAELDAIAQRCTDAIAPWAGCTIGKGLGDASCSEAEDVLARCIADDDAVNVAYLAVQDAKKAGWGNAEQYVELRGLFALFTPEQMAELRKACPETEDAALRTCLGQQPLTAQALQGFVAVAQSIANESAGELAKAGAALTPEQAQQIVDRMLTLFLTFPSRAVASVAKDCEKQHPELAELKDPKQIDAFLTCMEGGSDADPVANPAFISKEKLRGWLAKGRAKVEEIVRAKEAKAQGKSFQMVAIIFGGFAGLGALIVLLMPLWARRKNPNAKGLWAASAGAAGVFLMTMAMLGGTLLAIRTVQGVVGTDSTSPKMRLVDAAFSVLEKDDYIQTFSDLSKLRLDFIKTPLRQLSADVAAAKEAAADATAEERSDAVAAVIAGHWAQLLEQPELQRIAKNFKMLKEHVATYTGAIKLVKSLDGVLGYVPIVLSLLAVIMYLLPMRKRLIDIAMGPTRAATAGAGGAGAPALTSGMTTIKAELKIVLPYIGLILLLLPVFGFFIAFAVEPVMEMIINTALLNVVYVLGADASGFAVQASFIGAIVLLVLTLLVYILALSGYSGTVRKILSARFHDGRKLGEFKRFWIFGTAALLGLLAFPALFAQGARFAQTKVLEGVTNEIAGSDLWVVPVASIGAFIVLFWALRGLKALKQIKFKSAT